MKSKNPRSRTDGLVIRELDKEVLILDLRANRVMCLNETSAHVWRACDGTKTVGQIQQSLSEEMGSPESESESAVLLALELLRKDALLVNGENINNKFRGLSRRQAIKVFGAGILSSTGEIPYSLFSPDVTRQPFVTDVVINTDYNPSHMQNKLFVAPSLPFLRRELEGLVLRFGIPAL